MTISSPTPLLGGLSPQAFMRRHWQKRPLLVRQALVLDRSPVSRQELFALASRDDVESRLIIQDGRDWTLRHGPLSRRSLPRLDRPRWTMLVQGVDTQLQVAHELLSRFRFIPDARLDDLMISWASDGGGVGPHLDSYDVFLLQIQGCRRWRIGAPPAVAKLRPGLPLKILRDFKPEQEWLLGPGDMLYLPPGWVHEGVAQGECMTASIGFRASGRGELRDEVLQRMLDASIRSEPDPLYKDPGQAAVEEPARIPQPMLQFVAKEISRWFDDPLAIACALGEVLSEPKPGIWFESGSALPSVMGVRLDRRSRMIYDDHHVFINGESYRATGRDVRLMRRLADSRVLKALQVSQLSGAARDLLAQWARAGWVHSCDEGDEHHE